MGSYTEAEKLVLIAGMTSGRDTVWSQLPGAVECLADRGLVEMSRQERTDGTTESIPVSLSPAGASEARKLHESSSG
jgi:hypothetical protein